ncbi:MULTISPECIES: type 4a pilus biogenesis protein PilO [unclassified Nitrosomonas]|jgi:type IV pilus assembly protein PilO|uniref:type 4a pilus biogenesis protein PilO n=1 Tax=unclassified Nitrosomonas TaxID=2609265 RepID=UPI001E0D9DE2|nr:MULTISPECIES: type 4a pilus biogenesis protein PilO [unclassified Nitrosomonas]MBX9895135.1 type 4a pilus biogenesis protein PilO [Nitrosomonas sp.]WMJ08042.1 type 4a pilus biogenesis protein PilO [Nitrosomonas sp. sh817]
MENLLMELRQLDINRAGDWPVAFKVVALIILLIGIIAAGHFLIWQDEFETLERIQAEEETLKNTYLIKKRSAVNLPAMREQLQDIEKSLGTLLRQLPDKSEMEALLIDINQAGLGRGLQFELFKPATQETINAFYAELPVAIRVTGDYHAIGAFASDIAHLSRIVTLNDINVKPGNDGKLVLDAVAKTYRYLDEGELVKQAEGR